ncbi:MAG TPA: acyl-CoA dehydrogenase family protein, partial [Spongiibacteraceae bacterium]|nr:acyl-CoA dehydrogenase family protein [Spongiibacteraceae bacterium]
MILNETQQAIKDAIRDFAQERLRPNTLKFEADGGYPDGLFEEMAGLGLMGMTAPEEFGGSATDYVSYALALMEIAAGDGA